MTTRRSKADVAPLIELEGYYEDNVPVDLIGPPEVPVRQDLGLDSLNGVSSLATSIAQVGVIEPLVVQRDPGGGSLYRLIVGQRRLEAAREAGRTTVPCRVVTSELSESELLRLMLIENAERRAPTDVERCRAEARLKRLLIAEGVVAAPGEGGRSGRVGYARLVSRETGESEKSVENRVAVGEATEALQDALSRGVLTFRGAADLAREEPDVQAEVVTLLAEQGRYKTDTDEASTLSEFVKARKRIEREKDLSALEGRDGAEPAMPKDIVLCQNPVYEAFETGAFEGMLVPFSLLVLHSGTAVTEATSQGWLDKAVSNTNSGQSSVMVVCPPGTEFGVQGLLDDRLAKWGYGFVGQVVWAAPEGERWVSTTWDVTHRSVLVWTNGPDSLYAPVTRAGVLLPRRSVLSYAAPRQDPEAVRGDDPLLPPELWEWMVCVGCPIGGSVLHPHAGSGQMVAALRANGRRGLLIEPDAELAALAWAKIKLFT